MPLYKTPYTGNAAASREHDRLVRKGKAIAARMEADRMIAKMLKNETERQARFTAEQVALREATARQNAVVAEFTGSLDWDAPSNAPLCDGFIIPRFCKGEK